ncbi:MAG: Gfo/Idh/MocA family oxidoreductase [Alphaproteobacteria bacterium]|nr:Gfo/Idh/MocA family oxidoreductase [Alphaproteobacteria bacterium]
MASRKLKVGIVGLGGVGAVHLEAYRDNPRIEVVAAAELDEKRLATLASAHRFKPYGDFRRMLAEETLDLVCVATTVATHEEVTIACAKAGRHVLCEKPIAGSIDAAKRMIAACAEAKVKLFYCATYRFLPAVAKARALIQAGAVGRVLLMREQEVGGAGPENRHIMGFAHYPKGTPGGSGFGLVDHGIHLIDLFGWLSGSEVETVFGRGNISGDAASVEYLLMNFRNGALGHLLYEDGTFPTGLPGEGLFSWGSAWTLSGAYVPPGAWQAAPGSIHVHGDKGALRIFHYANQLFLTDKDGTRQVALEGRHAPGHFTAQMEACAATLLNGAATATSAEEGLAALEVLMAAYRSFEERRVVAL